uniref:7TM GPCR serpentine receptor class x (Srx) domain-containing protein n=1 Tax=Strongyloides venezuelensis TaxID=75913 RepID=A0A0K0G450_STRVS
MGIINLIYLIIHGLGGGYLALYGETYCNKPKLIIFIGSFSVGLWGAYCFTVLILLFNKCLALYNIDMNRIVFNRTNILGWLTIPSIYFLLLLNFTPPLIFSTVNNSWYFYPYTEYPKYQNSIVPRINLFYHLNNYFTVLVPTISLTFYILKSLGKIMANKQTPKLKKIPINHTLIHTIVLTTIISLTSILLIIFHFNNKAIIGIICEIIILTANGAPSLLYLTLNDKMKHDIHTMFHYEPKSKTPIRIFKRKIEAIS